MSHINYTKIWVITMNLPEKIKVAGVHYEIELLKDDENCGTCLFDSLIIRVDPRLKTEKQQQVFIHEMLHAVFWEAGYQEQDEEMIDRVSRVLYQVLKDNNMNEIIGK